MLSLMETWLNRKIPGCSVEQASFLLVLADRDKQSGKKLDDGFTFFVDSKCYDEGNNMHARYQTVSCGTKAN